MKIFLLIAFLFITGCQNGIKYPDGGYDYPKNISPKDTNFYYYQIKHIPSEVNKLGRDYQFLFYRPFNEPNLSIAAQKKETFRLTCSSPHGQSIIINVTEDSLIIKRGYPPSNVYAHYSNLTKLEEYHLYLFHKFFPIDTANKTHQHYKYFDSLVKLYPEILSKDYYNKILDKTIMTSGEKFEYETTRLAITANQFTTLVKQINNSGFWSLPHRAECDEQSADGESFTLEANTRKKYKFVNRSVGCPSETSNFPKICQIIIKLSKLNKEISLDEKGEAVPVY